MTHRVTGHNQMALSFDSAFRLNFEVTELDCGEPTLVVAKCHRSNCIARKVQRTVPKRGLIASRFGYIRSRNVVRLKNLKSRDSSHGSACQ